MSKTIIFAQPEEFCNSAYRHEKEKLKRQQRRISRKRLNKKRIKDSKSFDNHYYMKEERRQGIYKEVEIPEKRIAVGYEEWINEPYRYFKDDGTMEISWYPELVFRKTGEHVIPAHTVRKHTGSQIVAIKPYVKKYHFSKRSYKKAATRRLRNTSEDELYRGGQYKKNYDLLWDMY